MPKMPQQGGRPLVTPLAAMKLKPVFVDRWNDRYRLRTLTPPEVTAETAEWLSDPAIMEGLNAPQKAMGLDAFRAYVASFDNLRRNLMAIRNRADDRAIGLLFVEIDLRHRLGSLHMVLARRQAPIGAARHVTRIAMRHFFLERKLEKLTFQPLARNRAAIAACEAAALRLEGVLRSHRIDGRTGERLDQMLYAYTLEEYMAAAKLAIAEGSVPPYGGPDLKD
jgi:RimJ/RimL family protein N-acetyltransferase